MNVSENLRIMITPEENDLLCRVEGNAPMGQLMRRQWIAICLIEEVSEPDGAPIKARILAKTWLFSGTPKAAWA